METIVDKYGVEYDIKQKILIKASPDLREEYIIHQNTEIIHPFAFMDCKKIKSIVLPDKLQYIGSGSFKYCIYNHRTTKTNQKYPSVNL